MRAFFAIALVVSASLPLACSSVPDIHYVDGGTSGSSGTSGTSGSTSKPDASSPVSCPGNPPPADQGVCCGSMLCAHCTADHCTRCEAEGCGAGEICCAKNPVRVACSAASACN